MKKNKELRILGTLLALALVLLVLNLFLAESGGTWRWLLALQGLSWLACVGWAVHAWLRLASFHPSGFRSKCIHYLLLAGLLLSALAWRGAPAFRILKVQDQGYNSATAMCLLRTGQPSAAIGHVAAPGAWIAERPTQALRAEDAHDVGPTRRAYGFLFFDHDGRLRSVFPQGFPVLMAGFGALLGAEAIFWSNSIFLLGGAAVAGRLAGRYGGPASALYAGLLFAWCPLHLWFSATTFAEPTLAFVFLGSILLAGRDSAEEPRPSGILVAVFAAVLLPLFKFEGWLATVAILGCLLLAAQSWRMRRSLAIVGGLGCLLSLGLIAQGIDSYTLGTLASVVGDLELHSITAGLSGLALLAGFVALACFLKRTGGQPRTEDSPSPETGRDLGRWTRWRVLVVASSVLALFFFLWVRPMLFQGDQYYFWPIQSDILSWREVSIPRLTWYLSTPGLVLGFFGLMASLFPRKTDAVSLAAAMVFLTAFFFLAWDARINPAQPYAMRRFVGYVTPLLCIGLALWPLCLPRGSVTKLRRVQLFSGLAFALTFVVLSQPLFLRGAKAGNAYHTLKHLDEQLEITGSGPIYLPTESTASAVAIPLQLGFGQPIVPLERTRDLYAVLDAVRSGQYALAPGADLRLLVGDSSAETILRQNPRLQQEAKIEFKETFLGLSTEAKPWRDSGGFVNRAFDLYLLRFQPAVP